MPRTTTVADLRQMLADLPDYYSVVIDLEQNMNDLIDWHNAEPECGDEDEVPLLDIESVDLSGNHVETCVVITGSLR